MMIIEFRIHSLIGQLQPFGVDDNYKITGVDAWGIDRLMFSLQKLFEILSERNSIDISLK